jgi:hypothetical protein
LSHPDDDGGALRAPERSHAMSTGAWVSVPHSDITAPWRLATAAAPFLPMGADPYADPYVDGRHRFPDERMRLVALELVGPKASADAIRRALKRGEDVALGGGPTRNIPSRIGWAPGGIVELARRLPSGQTHALLLHPQAALTRLDPEGRIFLIDSGTHHDPEHAYAVLSAALPLPVLPAWAPWLLDQGRHEGLVVTLPAHGFAAAEIIADVDRWAALIQAGLRRKALSCAS